MKTSCPVVKDERIKLRSRKIDRTSRAKIEFWVVDGYPKEFKTYQAAENYLRLRDARDETLKRIQERYSEKGCTK